jgi:hypothetical protein
LLGRLRLAAFHGAEDEGYVAGRVGLGIHKVTLIPAVPECKSYCPYPPVPNVSQQGRGIPH